MTNAAKRKRKSTKDFVAVAGNLKWKWGGHVARMDQRRCVYAASMWGLRTGKRRMGATEEPMGQTRSRVVWSGQKPERTE
jgi:hypothetical protein